ncbi:helix-turn-helix transcriptional regulator [Mucilaginibacter sp. RB4R14]|uniref:response regulator transcription factor n=1 Tax=Mucilaginibacter aurantiaciroseus TaxID=2949308 RepID=UPI00209134AA|nr:helix-turn-helix transcriptional regulator [Mucilaginibacter aurantiaciroseus]MCO5936742.1 helix-turn-helix transcriptional regulator [Mucilaginibacter aurantiaciroseus]
MLHKLNLPKQIIPKIEEFATMLNLLPCTVIIHDLRDWSVVYISKRGLDGLQTSIEDITSITAQEYYKRYFNADDAQDYVPRILTLLENNNNEEIVTYFQQVRFPRNDDWTWHMSSTKIFMRDHTGKPSMTITVAIPLDAMHHMNAKADRLLADNNFLRKNFKQYSQLTKREKEVLALVAHGKSAAYIANELFISVTTAETHRKNIKKKLNAGTYELMQYARAFDLI